MNGDFYRAFEERYYAPCSVIKELRKQYLPFTDIVRSLYPCGETYDLGCGRGEWLELMLESGMKPFGVDLDGGMLQSCYEHHLPAKQGDAVSYLTSLADDSQAIVSAFHVVEHIHFDQLRTVVVEALRVLKPGGLLIMETPNPENIVVSTQNFYLDPTHQRPIPPQLLSFLPEYYGFARVKTIRLQESKDLIQSDSLTLRNVFEGVSPDYAVIAQKAADETIIKAFDDVFAVEYGLRLETLATRYHTQLETTAHQATEHAAQAETIARQAIERAAQAETIARQAIERAAQAEAKAQNATEHAAQAGLRVQALLSSSSWRITAPLRWFGTQVRLLRQHGFRSRAKALVKKMSNPAVRRVFFYISSKPRLRIRCATVTKKIGLYGPLRTIYRRYTGRDKLQDANPTNNMSGSGQSLAYLTPRARQIYADLKIAIEQSQKESH